MPESGVKATVDSLSLGASGLLSAVSSFFPLLCLSLLLGCIRMEAFTSPRLCVQVPAGAAPSPSFSLRPRATLPLLCSPEKPHLQPPELFPSPPATTCPFLYHGPASWRPGREESEGGRKALSGGPHIWGSPPSHPSLPRAWLPAHLPLGGPELGDRCFREGKKNDEGWQGLKSHLHSLPPVPAGLLNLKMWIKTCEHCRGEESLPTLGPTTHCRKGSVWKRRASSYKLRAGIAVCKPEGNWAAAGIPGPHLPFLM